jgi:hypothetical protein
MGLLVLLSGWLYGGDVHRLGSEWYPERWAASERLRAAGWLAYPALLTGSRSDSVERADRCAELANRLDGWVREALEVEGVARGILPLSPVASDEFMEAVCRRVDALGGWKTSEAWVWVRASPYQFGTRRGDCQHAIRMAAAHRAVASCFPPLVPGLPK